VSLHYPSINLIVSAINFTRSRAASQTVQGVPRRNQKWIMVTLCTTMKLVGLAMVKFCNVFYHC